MVDTTFRHSNIPKRVFEGEGGGGCNDTSNHNLMYTTNTSRSHLWTDNLAAMTPIDPVIVVGCATILSHAAAIM